MYQLCNKRKLLRKSCRNGLCLLLSYIGFTTFAQELQKRCFRRTTELQTQKPQLSHKNVPRMLLAILKVAAFAPDYANMFPVQLSSLTNQKTSAQALQVLCVLLSHLQKAIFAPCAKAAKSALRALLSAKFARRSNAIESTRTISAKGSSVRRQSKLHGAAASPLTRTSLAKEFDRIP